MKTYRISFIIIICAFVFVTSGCTTTPKEKSWETVPPLLDFPQPKEKNQAHVGIYYEPDMESYLFKKLFMSSVLVVPIGKESANMFDKAIPMVFQSSVKLNGMPPYDTGLPKLDGIIEARLDYVDFRIAFDSDTEQFSVAYLLTFYSSEGVPISSWRIVGNGTGMGGWDNYNEHLANDMKDAAEKFVSGFRDAPETKRFREYLKSEHANINTLDADMINVETTTFSYANNSNPKATNGEIIGIRVAVENQSNQKIVVRGSDARLMMPDKSRLTPAFPQSIISILETESDAYDSAGTSALVGPTLGTLGAFSDLSANTEKRSEMNQEFEEKRLKESNLLKGASIEGDIYFILPKRVSKLNNVILSLWIVDQSSGDGHRKEIQLCSQEMESNHYSRWCN